MKKNHVATQDLTTALRGMPLCDTQEMLQERWRRFYAAEGGPLVAWLLDEAAQREFTVQALAAELNVTVGYLAQLQCGLRKTEDISRDFAAACAIYLGVPAVVVLVVAGHLKLIDFVTASHFDRWVADEYAQSESTVLPSGISLGDEEFRVLPRIVCELRNAAAIHERRCSGLWFSRGRALPALLFLDHASLT